MLRCCGRWWLRWCRWTGFDEAVRRARAAEDVSEVSARQPPARHAALGKGQRPAAIDNSKLLEVSGDTPKLRPGLMEGLDYTLVSEPTWRALVSWCAAQRAVRCGEWLNQRATERHQVLESFELRRAALFLQQATACQGVFKEPLEIVLRVSATVCSAGAETHSRGRQMNTRWCWRV